MINGTLKDYYSGNDIPCERRMMTGSDVARASAELTKAEDRLKQALGDEADSLLAGYENAQDTLNALTAEANYIDGFKTGARFMMEILDRTHENIKPMKD